MRSSKAGQQGLGGQAGQRSQARGLGSKPRMNRSSPTGQHAGHGKGTRSTDSDIAGLFPLLNLLEEPSSSVAKPTPVGTEIL